MSMPTKEFLHWISDRLVNVYGDDPHTDFIYRLREIADAQPPDDGPWEWAAMCNGDIFAMGRDRKRTEAYIARHREHSDHEVTFVRRPLSWQEVPDAVSS